MIRKNKLNTKLFHFNTGTDGLKRHQKFIKMINKKGFKIVHSYTLFNRFSKHSPEYLCYVIQFKTDSLTA